MSAILISTVVSQFPNPGIDFGPTPKGLSPEAARRRSARQNRIQKQLEVLVSTVVSQFPNPGIDFGPPPRKESPEFRRRRLSSSE
ncbi:hypothetical protein BKA69DRAFT_1124354 [Paraphysoderma sedebokerense]|nr:hypothetical protein BKA69DRAFT_1124354 [Paraphysoderma sedebokerense]